MTVVLLAVLIVPLTAYLLHEINKALGGEW